MSDEEYRRRYEGEVRRYASRYRTEKGVLGPMGPGEAYLASGRWAWIEGGETAIARWCRYARGYRGLKAMNPDGTWRVWDPRTVR